MAFCRPLTGLILGSLVGLAQSASIHATLKDGVIRYTAADGQSKAINVGKKCGDLWVAPDESVIAFIAIDKDLGTDPAAPEVEPFITESSIYIARRSAGLAPVRVNVGPIRAYGRDLKAFRNPRVAPGEGSIIFNGVISINSYEVFAHDLKTGQNKDIGGAVEWCVEWGGSRSGSVLMQRRYISENVIKLHCLRLDRARE